MAKPKCVWKSGQPVLNSTKEISIQKRNGISICPRHGMLCSLAQHKPSPSHASHVGSKLRQVTCATRMVGRSLLRALTKLSVTVATSSHRIIRGLISPDWPRFSKSLVLSRLMPLSTNLVPIASTALHQWLEQLDECGVDPLNLPAAIQAMGGSVPLCIPPSESAANRQGQKGRQTKGKQRCPEAGLGTGKGRDW